MFTRKVRANLIDLYAFKKSIGARFLRFQYAHDWQKPRVVTRFPGAQHEEALQQSEAAHSFDQHDQLQRFVNMKQSRGNFFVDTDGNVVLDLDCAQALGYNHDRYIDARDSLVYDRFLQGKTDLTGLPPHDYADILRDQVMPVSPSGMDQVHLADGSTTTANEVAISTAIMKYAIDHKVDYQNLSVLGFEYGSHGKSVATLSCSDDAVNHSGLPTYDWPKAPLPQLKYPLARHEKANREEEDRCFEAYREIIETRRADGKDVAAVIIEPITSFQNKQATPNFYKRLRALAKEEGIPFIVDETRTGFGQSGKMWAHEHWYLQDYNGGAPDLVTFGGKAGISGHFSTSDFRLNPHCAQFDQDVDMVKVINFGIAWQEIQRVNQLAMVSDASTFLKVELGHIQRDKGLITDIRGNGTFIGFDFESSETAESMRSWLQKNGIQVSRSGPRTFGLRPSLVLEPKHCAALRDAINAYHPNHVHH